MPALLRAAPQRYKHKATIVVISHRKDMVGEAMMSAMRQTHPSVQVLVTYSTRGPDFGRVNAQVQASTGEWIGVLCDDDMLDPEYVERLLTWETQADVLYTDRIVFGNIYADHGEGPKRGYVHPTHSRKIEGVCRTFTDPESFVFGSPLLMTILVRRTLWDAHGGYNPALPHADTELWYRLIRGDPAKHIPPASTVYVPEPLMYYRNHPGQLSVVDWTMLPALRSFHREHFMDFGMVVGKGEGTTQSHLELSFVQPSYRLGYVASHFTSLTTTGWFPMPTETKALSPIAKIAIALQIKSAQDATNAVITAALTDAGLSPDDGWKVTPEGDAIREVATPNPEPQTGPVLVIDAPLDAPKAFTASPTFPVTELPTSTPA